MTTTEPTAESAPAQVSGVDIELIDVEKRYPGQEKAAVENLNLHVPAGEIVMFVGPSGCGKTTSLKMINRLIEPTGGRIEIDGTDVQQRNSDDLRRHVGYVIQGGSLFPHMTVAQNIAITPKLLGWDKQRIAKRVDELLDLVNLEPGMYRDRYPRELSGGQQQRVGVARGLAADPPVVLMDEPFGAVDPITRQRLQDELMRIQEELRKTIVAVTHDIDEAIKLGDRIVILQEGGHVAQYDTPEAILAAPATEFVEDFVGTGATLKQLSLRRVTELDLGQRTTATIGERSSEVAERAERNGDRAVIVLDERKRPRAWVWLREIRASEQVAPRGEDELNTIDRRSTLNDALDTMLTSSHGAAVVTGHRGEYLGVIDFDAVTEHMRSAEERAAIAAEHTDDQGRSVRDTGATRDTVAAGQDDERGDG